MLISSTGVTHYDKERATPGYTLFSPIDSEIAKIVNMEGETVHKWDLERGGTNLCALLDNGNLFITEKSVEGPKLTAGRCGLMREYDWDGNVVWEHVDSGQHHDARRLPNGNTLYITWRPLDDATAKKVRGGIPGSDILDGEKVILEDVLREVDAHGNVAWEWHSSNLDMDKYELCPLCRRHEWAHANTCSPLANGDIMVSYRLLNLLIIVDRQTGEIKWEHQDINFGHQHDCQMLDNGNVLVFCNGYHGSRKFYSRIQEFLPDTGEIVWEYMGDPLLSFYSPHISGVQRLANGNTLICEGGQGCIFEVTPDGDVVWEFINEITGTNLDFGQINWIFRATRYLPDDPKLQNRLPGVPH